MGEKSTRRRKDGSTRKLWDVSDSPICHDDRKSYFEIFAAYFAVPGNVHSDTFT
jgi:hypothetical protein